MYRGSQESHLDTIARLEAEVAELRSVVGPRGPRARSLWGVTGLAVVVSILAGAACGSAHARSQRLERHMALAASLLDSKRQDLSTCEQTLESEVLKLQAKQTESVAMRGGFGCWQQVACDGPPADVQ